MLFHEYLGVLYDYCGGGVTTAEFVRGLFQSSMSYIGKMDLFPDDSLPQKLFNGNSKISKQLAGKVRINLDQDCFIGYIDKAAADARKAFMEAFGADSSMDDDEFQERLFQQFRLFIDNPGKDAANVIGEEIKKAPPPCERSTEAQREYDEAVGRYLASARNYYSRIKTLLYDKESKDFYSFYICNELARHTDRKCAATVHSVTAQKLMEISRFIIITGTGGLGKSMMMKHLLLDGAESYDTGKRIPVFVPLKNFEQSPMDMTEYICDTIQGFCPSFSREMFDYALQSGELLILFDGLDEVRQEDMPRFERGVERLTNQYPQNGFVISSRPFSEFVSFQQFCVLELQPFSKEQAIRLIQKLEFCPDEPEIKEQFLADLDNRLYDSHLSFARNPLLLTIILMTYERYAEVPTKMHIFYREAYLTLTKRHDARKGSFTRLLRSGLGEDQFADCFAEFCFHTYLDRKHEMTDAEFARYFSLIDTKARASDFLFDLCHNVCLILSEGNKYFFIHRSFQEYFAAVFMSKQDDEFLASLIEQINQTGMTFKYSDKTYYMLRDMIPKRFNERILAPYLKELFDDCDRHDGYWTFLERIYPVIYYAHGEAEFYVETEIAEDLFKFVEPMLKIQRPYMTPDDLPFDDAFVNETNYDEYEGEDGEIYHKTEIGWNLSCEVAEILMDDLRYQVLQEILDSDDFIFKKQYVAARELLGSLCDMRDERKARLLSHIARRKQS